MNIEIPEDMAALLRDVSKKMDASPEYLVVSALQEYLEDHHDYHVGIEAYHAYLQSGRQSISLDDLKKDLKLD